MCLYGVDDVCVLVIALAKIYADIDMRAFHLAVNCLADIMQQAGALCLCGIDAQLSGENAGDMRNLNGVLQHILTIACAVTHASEQLDQLRMQTVHAGFENCAFAFLLDDLILFAAALFDHFFDARRMDADVNDELLQRQTGNFAANRVETGQSNRLRRIVDDEIDTG